MKHLFSILCLCMALVGCAAAQPYIPEQRTGTVEISVPERTERAEDGSTIIVPAHTETKEFQYTVSVPNPNWTTAIDVAKDVNSFVNPTPTAPLVNWGLSILSTGLAALGGFLSLQQKRKAEQAVLEHERTLNAAATIVRGVEKARNNPGVKETIRDVSMLEGTAQDVHELVQTLTRKKA